MCHCHTENLTFENMLSDPLIRLVMDSDGVSVEAFAEEMEKARSVAWEQASAD